MKLYQYDDIKKLNQALGSFAKNQVPVAKVKLLTVGEKIQYFVLADPKEVYQKPLETEAKTLKTLKVKKEKKVEVKTEPVAEATPAVEEKVEEKKEEVKTE